MKRLTIGILIWIAIAAVFGYISTQQKNTTKAATSQLADFFLKRCDTFEIEFEVASTFKVGDRVFIFDQESNEAVQVGMIVRVESLASDSMKLTKGKKAFVELFPNAPKLTSKDYLAYHDTPDSMGWVIEQMLPPEKRKAYAEKLLTTFRENQKELNELLKPIIQKSIAESVVVIQADLKVALEKRSEAIRKIGDRLQTDLVKEDLVPLIQEQIWPVIQQEVAPVMNTVGQEMWKKVSVWRFGWRYIYDASPLPEKDLTKKEFNRFLEEHAVPILQSHADDFLEVQKAVLRSIAENETVRSVVRESVREFVNDDEVQVVFGEIFKEVVVNNERLHTVWQRNWNSEQAQDAIALASSRMQPTVEEIGRAMFGNPEEPIPPEFARVLRNRILFKDERWMTLQHYPGEPALTEGAVIPVIAAEPKSQQDNPFYSKKRSGR